MRASQAAGGALIVGPVGEDASDGFVILVATGRNFTAERRSSAIREGGEPCLAV